MSKIDTVNDFRLALMDGAYAWPGGYPRYFIMRDGEALSFDAAQENADLIEFALEQNHQDDWRVVAAEINWEDEDLVCTHTGKVIECAYPSDDIELSR